MLLLANLRQVSLEGKFFQKEKEQMTNLLNEKEAAEMLSVSLATLRRRRSEGRPPQFVKIGSSVRYRLEHLEAFIAASVVPVAAEKEAA